MSRVADTEDAVERVDAADTIVVKKRYTVVDADGRFVTIRQPDGNHEQVDRGYLRDLISADEAEIEFADGDAS